MFTDNQEKNIISKLESILEGYINKKDKGIVMTIFILFKSFIKDYMQDADSVALFNHNRDIESFNDEIKILNDNGFYPIGVSQLYLEDVFIFEDNKESKLAYETLEESKDLVVGFWYGKYEFFDEVIKYEKENNSKVKIIWL